MKRVFRMKKDAREIHMNMYKDDELFKGWNKFLKFKKDSKILLVRKMILLAVIYKEIKLQNENVCL